MTTYELFQQEPAVIIISLLISLIVTLVVYSAFPLIFASIWKKNITKKKYKLFCYGINLFLMLLLFDSSSGGPYVLWTWVFSGLGVKILDNKGFLNKINEVDSSEMDIASQTESEVGTNLKVSFCRKCGYKLQNDTTFCSECGTKVIIEE